VGSLFVWGLTGDEIKKRALSGAR